jgi:PEP-CTERM motif
MKPTRSFKLLATSVLCVLAFSSVSYADIVFGDGALTVASPTAHATGQSTSGSGLQYYNVFAFTVDTTGSYVFELASINSVGTPSNALDTWLGIFANTFTPPALGTPAFSNDDFTGTLTVLPGPYSSMGLTATSTGFTGAQPGSRLASVSLAAGTQYFLYVSSFRDTTFVSTTSAGQAVGQYYFGISGPGVISGIPEPTTVALLTLGALAVGVRTFRKRKVA